MCMNKACDKQIGGSKESRDADCETGGRPQSESSPVSVGALTASADLSFPRGLCERAEMWCYYTDTSHSRVSSGHVGSPSPWTPPSLFSFFLILSRETTGARRNVTAVSGMLGGRWGYFPGFHLHLRLSDTGTRLQQYLREESSKQDRAAFIIKCFITEVVNETAVLVTFCEFDPITSSL